MYVTLYNYIVSPLRSSNKGHREGRRRRIRSSPILLDCTEHEAMCHRAIGKYYQTARSMRQCAIGPSGNITKLHGA